MFFAEYKPPDSKLQWSLVPMVIVALSTLRRVEAGYERYVFGRRYMDGDQVADPQEIFYTGET